MELRTKILLALCLLLVAVIPVSAAEFHLGSQNVYAGSADTISIPVLITNFEKEPIQDVGFAITYDSTKVQFVEAKPAPALADDWVLDTGNPSLVKAGGSAIQGEWAQLFDLKFSLNGLGTGDSVSVNFKDIVINSLPQHTTVSTAFKIYKQSAGSGFPKGDINGDYRVDFEDVRAAFDTLTRGSTIPNAATLLEISGSQPTGFHDAALLYQHVTGLLPDIANVPAPAVPQFISNITVEKDSVPLAGDIYRYRLKAFDLAGLISATVNLKVDTGVVQKVQAVYVNSGAALIHGQVEGDNFKIYMSSARPVADSVFDWVTMVVVHKSGQTGTGLSLPPVIQASLNENLFRTAGNCITITSPSAGQIFETEDPMNIKWESPDFCFTEAILRVSAGGGAFRIITTTPVTQNDNAWGDYDWYIPASVSGMPMVSDSVVIQVRENMGPEVANSSVFTVNEKPVVGKTNLPVPSTGIINAWQRENIIVVDIQSFGTHSVIVMDRLGRVINKGQGQGVQTYEFAGNGLAPGVYFVRVMLQGVSHVRKVVVR